jgi:hypothetical protein
MKKIKLHIKVLSVFSCLAIMLSAGAVLVPQHKVNALSCGSPPSVGSGSGSNLSLEALSDVVDSATKKIGLELTPQQSWSPGTSLNGTMGGFSTSACTPVNATISFSIRDSVMHVYYYDYDRTTGFVQGTDYKDVATGAAVTSGSNTQAILQLTPSPINQAEAQLISVDMSDNGWAEILLKQGSSAETSLVKFKLPANTAAFYSGYGQMSLTYSPPNSNTLSCTSIVGSGEIKVRAFADSNTIGLVASPKTAATCGDFDVSSYDSATKTASLKYTTSGKTPNHVFMHRYSGLKLDGEPKDNYNYGVGDFSSLETVEYPIAGGMTYYPKASFYGSKSANQEVYFMVRAYSDDQVVPKNTPYPIVAAKYNFAASDIDLGDDFKLDTSAELYASMAHGLASHTADGKFSLFAPQKEGDAFVGVCPGADKIDAVNTTCADLYFIGEGQSKNGASASIVTVGATKFWRVDGLTGTGIFSSTVGEIPGVPDTGASSTARLVVVALGSAAVLVLGAQARRRLLQRR